MKVESQYIGTNYVIYTGDCCQIIKGIPDNSVHYELHSPPFSQLYIYSDSISDMGNCKDDDEFFTHYRFLIPELYRILIPGRLCSVHCKDLVDYKGSSGRAGLRDFSGAIIRAFEDGGFKYHSRVTIWKDPVIEMQRTKSQGLLHKQIKSDSTMSRQGLPDYLLTFRKWPEDGETSGPEPVCRPNGFKKDDYVGDEKPDFKFRPIADELDTEPTYDSILIWQKYASPVWFDINQTRVLNSKLCRNEEDEKHICPLQLDVIERAIHLWTLPGDVVFTPFAGIGSELYGALNQGRKAIGIELKPEYAEFANSFCNQIETAGKQLQLF